MICTDIPAPSYLIFSNSVPHLLYYSHIPTALVALLMGFFVYFKNKNLLSKILLSLSVVFVLWLFFSLISWTSIDSDWLIFVYSFFGILTPFIFILCFYFVYAFMSKNDMDFKLKIFLGSVLSFASVFSYKNAASFDLVNCGANDGGWYSMYFFYGTELFFALWILIYGIYKYVKEKTDFRKQILLLIIGIELFLFSFFVTGFLASYLMDKGYVNNFGLEFYGLFGMTAFMGFLAYLIVKYKAFNIKLLGVQALVVAQFIIIASMFAFTTSATNQILIGVTLAGTTIMGWYMVRSVKAEVKRKEELQLMSEKLSQANDQLRKLDNAKSEFISIASHQLRTPLTAIKGFVSLILEGTYGEVLPQVREALNKVYLSGERLIRGTFVQNVLDTAEDEG